jgi:hypothetical protein
VAGWLSEMKARTGEIFRVTCEAYASSSIALQIFDSEFAGLSKFSISAYFFDERRFSINLVENCRKMKYFPQHQFGPLV